MKLQALVLIYSLSNFRYQCNHKWFSYYTCSNSIRQFAYLSLSLSHSSFIYAYLCSVSHTHTFIWQCAVLRPIPSQPTWMSDADTHGKYVAVQFRFCHLTNKRTSYIQILCQRWEQGSAEEERLRCCRCRRFFMTFFFYFISNQCTQKLLNQVNEMTGSE